MGHNPGTGSFYNSGLLFGVVQAGEKYGKNIRTHYSRWKGQAALYVQYCKKN